MKSFLISLVFTFAIFSANAQLSAPDVEYTKLGPLTIQPVQHASLILTVHGLTIYADPSGAENFATETAGHHIDNRYPWRPL